MLSVLFYLFFMVFTLVYFLLFSVVFFLTVPFDRKRVVMHYLSRVWTKGYFSLVPSWKVVVEGRENVDPDKSYVIIVNHTSMIDIIMMYVIPLNFKWVAKKEVYRWPIFGWVMHMHGDIGIERGTAGGMKKMLREGRHWLDMGVSVIIFPEGSRSRGGQLGRFKEGAFSMARNAGVGILPCVSLGTGTATRGWKINFSNVYRVRILPEVPAETVANTSTKELACEMQELIASELEKLKQIENERSS